ncbi:DUF4394 domain-containing protein [Halpernia sp. GG3]
MKNLFKTLFVTLTLVSTISCKNEMLDPMALQLSLNVGPDSVAYGLTQSNELVVFNTNKPAVFSSKISITGLVAGEKILSIDFRPATGELYAVSDASKFYIINTTTASARIFSTTAFTPAISGSTASIDFYSNNFAGATTTSLFVIDHITDRLYLQNPPNAGSLADVGPLGINITAANGFDIGSTSQKAYLLASVGTDNKIFTVNTSTDVATSIATYPNSVRGFSVGLGF